jgi:hypothetical protein
VHRIAATYILVKRRNHFHFGNFFSLSLSLSLGSLPSLRDSEYEEHMNVLLLNLQEQYEEHMNVLPLRLRILIIIIFNFFLTQILPNHLFLGLKHKLGFKNPKSTQTLFFYPAPLNPICFLLVIRDSIQNQIKCITSISQTHNHQKL